MTPFGLDDLMEAFDALPRPLRAWLHSAVCNWGAVKVHERLGHYEGKGCSPKDAVTKTLQDCRNAELREMSTFAEFAFGGLSPHLAAEASLQPYGRREPLR